MTPFRALPAESPHSSDWTATWKRPAHPCRCGLAHIETVVLGDDERLGGKVGFNLVAARVEGYCAMAGLEHTQVKANGMQQLCWTTESSREHHPCEFLDHLFGDA